MGFEISTLRPEPSFTGTPFAIFNPASTSAEERPSSDLSTASDSELIDPTIPGRPVFKAVPEKLRNAIGALGKPFPSGNFMEFTFGKKGLNLPPHVRPDLSDKAINLGGEGNNYMAFTLGDSDTAEATTESVRSKVSPKALNELEKQIDLRGLEGGNMFDENVRRIRQSLNSRPSKPTTSHPHHRYNDPTHIRSTTRIPFSGPAPFTVRFKQNG